MGKQKERDNLELSKVIEIFSSELSKANVNISEKMKGTKEVLAYLPSEVTLSFPAELTVEEDKPIIRFTSLKEQIMLSTKKGVEKEKLEQKPLATVTINFKPIPT